MFDRYSNGNSFVAVFITPRNLNTMITIYSKNSTDVNYESAYTHQLVFFKGKTKKFCTSVVYASPSLPYIKWVSESASYLTKKELNNLTTHTIQKKYISHPLYDPWYIYIYKYNQI